MKCFHPHLFIYLFLFWFLFEVDVSNFESFKKWWLKAKQTLKCGDYEAYEIWQAGAASRQAEIENSYKIGYQDGFNSRQGEIDELQEMYIQQDLTIAKLQKRIDDALDHTINHGGYDDLTHIIKILKGESK